MISPVSRSTVTSTTCAEHPYAGDVPTAAEADYGVPTVASVPRQTGIDSPGEQRLLDALLATEPYRNLTPEYKAWFTEEAVRALQQLPLKYRQALVQDARALVEMAQPGVPQQISYYLTFAAAAEVASETGVSGANRTVPSTRR